MKTRQHAKGSIGNPLIAIGDALSQHPLPKLVDKPTPPHAFMPSRTVGECAGCIYPEHHEIHQLQPCKSVIFNQDTKQPFPFTIYFLKDGKRLRKQQVRHMDQAIALMSAWCTNGELLKPLNYSTRHHGSAWKARNPS